MSFPNVDQFINLLVSIPADGHENSFTYVMTEWTKQQGKHLYSLSVLSSCTILFVYLMHHDKGFLAISTYFLLSIYFQGRYNLHIKSKSQLQLWPCYCPLDILNSRRSMSQAVRFRSYAVPICYFLKTQFTLILTET